MTMTISHFINHPENLFVVLRKDADSEYYMNKEDLPVQSVIKIQLYDGMTWETLVTKKEADIAILTLKHPLKFSPEVCWKHFYIFTLSPFSYIRSVYRSMKTLLQMEIILMIQNMKIVMHL